MMRTLRTLVMSVALCASWASAAAETQDPSLELKRVNLVVADLDRALTIYRDVLGFSVFGISESSSTSYSYPVFNFPARAKLRFATLSTRLQPRSLALTEVRGVRLPRRPTMHLSTPVIRVGQLEAILERLRPMGVKIIAPQTSTTPENLPFIEAAFVDFDGNLIVIYQLDVSQKQP